MFNAEKQTVRGLSIQTMSDVQRLAMITGKVKKQLLVGYLILKPICICRNVLFWIHHKLNVFP